MASTADFSSNGIEVISREVHINATKTPLPASGDFLEFYEIDRTINCIQEGDYKRIALQFPDELLHDSVPVYHCLRQRLEKERELYVLADTSYGSCCVDEVAASHVDADFVIHYGHACLSQTSRLPVLYVFGRSNLDIEDLVNKVSAYLTTSYAELVDVKDFEIRHAVELTHISGEFVHALRLAVGDRYRVLYNPIPSFTHPLTSASLAESNGVIPGNAEIEHAIPQDNERKIILWVGEESTTLTKILMTSSKHTIISYSPSYRSVQSQSNVSNKMLRRRYAILQKARDSDVFGILIGTLGVASYLPLISFLRNQLKKAQKKSYTVSVGKINPAKLANFLEIECWIWVSCTEGMVDSKDFLRPIITPFELGLALQTEPTWTSDYVLDFQEVLSRASLEESKNGNSVENDNSDTDQPSFSLVSGTYRHAKRYNDELRNSEGIQESNNSQELIQRSQENAIAKLHNSAAAHFLQERSYQGLDPRLGHDGPSILEQGRTGIARGYGEV